MKAVIVEIRGDRAAALLEDGCFVGIPDSDYAVGQEIILIRKKSSPGKNNNRLRRRFAAIAASAAVVLSAGGGGLAYAIPYGTVSIDVNPSIEYTINRFDRVLRVYGVNEDGQAILEEIDKSRLLNRKIDQALSATIDQLEADGYLTGEEDAIVFSSGTESEEHSAFLAASLEEHFSPQAEIYSVAVSREEISSAHSKGTTAGKIRLIDEAGQGAPEPFRETDWIDRPVNDLMHAFRQRPDSGAQTGSDDVAFPQEMQEKDFVQKELFPSHKEPSADRIDTFSQNDPSALNDSTSGLPSDEFPGEAIMDRNGGGSPNIDSGGNMQTETKLQHEDSVRKEGPLSPPENDKVQRSPAMGS